MGVFRRYQSEIYGKYRRAAIRDGIITGGVMFVAICVMKILQNPISGPVHYVTDVVLLTCTLLFAWRYRKVLPDERVYFQELMLYGIWMGFVAAIVYGFMLYFYGEVIDKDFLSRCIEKMIQGEQAKELVNERSIEIIERYRVVNMSIMGAFRTAVMGIMTAFIAALIYRTEQNKERNTQRKEKKIENNK